MIEGIAEKNVVASIVVLLSLPLALAQPLTEAESLARIGVSGESSQSARRLQAADQLARDKHWTEAALQYQRIIREGGDELVRVDSYRSVQARQLCHQRLAAMPAAALAIYRARADNQAKQWLDEGKATRDPQLLRRLVDESFCSRFTDQALDLLGDLAFERGDFDEADHWWRLLALPGSEPQGQGQADELTFPDPRVDPARVRAKQIVSLLFRGQPVAATAELEAFRQRHAAAAGDLAGRSGNYADIVAELIARERGQARATVEEGWLTFGGDPTRNFVAPGPQARFAPLATQEGPTWSVPLQPAFAERPPGQESDHPVQDARGLAWYPVIAGNKVLVTDARQVRGYDLFTGRLILKWPDAADQELGIAAPERADPARPPARPDLAYTLTTDGERVYARLGAQGIGAGKEKIAPSFLVCLNVSGKVERWKIEAAAGNIPAFFEGSPVVHAGRVYAAITRLTGIETTTALACYDSDTGTLLWQRDVCSTQELRDGERRYRHHLVTLAGTAIAYCSHSGAIVAVDAQTGRRIWGVRYLSRGLKTAPPGLVPRSLTPCLFDGQRLYAAPADYDRILCLDAATGRQLWESASLEVVHLLAVAEGRVLFSSLTPRGCIRALEASTGNPVPGWLFPWSARLTPFGRGLVANGEVFWPTWELEGRLCLLDQASGELVQVARGIRGNLAAAQGCLVAADLDRLSAYIPESLLHANRRAEANAANRSAVR
jgi:outer membrane protein assembly factor BamB